MRRWTILVFLVMLSGCASLGLKTRDMKFEDTTRLYERVIEWSNFEKLGLFVKITEGTPAPDPSGYENIKVTSYQPGRGQATQEGNVVLRLAQLRYVQLSSMREHTLSLREVWVYSKNEQRWFLESGLPQFR